MAQMKKQIKTPENKTEINNLSDAEFKILVIRMFKELSEDQIHVSRWELPQHITVWVTTEIWLP